MPTSTAAAGGRSRCLRSTGSDAGSDAGALAAIGRRVLRRQCPSSLFRLQPGQVGGARLRIVDPPAFGNGRDKPQCRHAAPRVRSLPARLAWSIAVSARSIAASRSCRASPCAAPAGKPTTRPGAMSWSGVASRASRRRAKASLACSGRVDGSTSSRLVRLVSSSWVGQGLDARECGGQLAALRVVEGPSGAGGRCTSM